MRNTTMLGLIPVGAVQAIVRSSKNSYRKVCCEAFADWIRETSGAPLCFLTQ